MNKLIYANLHRIKQEKWIWLIAALLFLGSAFIVILHYLNTDKSSRETIDTFLFSYVTLWGIILAGFVSMFIGTEYSDGTIRNKVIVGQKRVMIYFVNFITCTLVGIVFSIAAMLGTFAIGLPLLKEFTLPAVGIASYILLTFLLTASFTAIFVLISMLSTNKARSVFLCLILSFVLFFVGSILYELLQAPEFISMYEMTIDGKPLAHEIPNPRYLQGMKRVIVQTVFDIIPSGQSIQIAGLNVSSPVLSGLYSIIISLLIGVTGCFLFKRKDLK